MLFLLCHLACAATYGLLAGIILLQRKRNVASVLLLLACAFTTAWALVSVATSPAINGTAPVMDLVRALAWYAVVLHLYHVTVSDRRHALVFVVIGCGVMVGGLVLLATRPGVNAEQVTLWGGGIPLRLLVSISQLVLLENLYRGTPVERRWHVGLACVALGSLAGYDLLMSGDAVLAHTLSLPLVEGRAVVAALVAPLLAVSAARNRNWGMTLHASRTAVFHTATLMGSGVFLVSLAAVAEFLRRGPLAGNSDWPEVLEIALLFSAFVGIAVLLVSASARNRLARLVSEHFFTYRYDYRREWLRCIATLSDDDGADPDGLPRRAIRAIADIVDSPAGLLLSSQPGGAGLTWAGSWNLPAMGPIPPGAKLLDVLGDGCSELTPAVLGSPELAEMKLWLGVPLTTRDGGLTGCVLLAPPRGPFRLDDEVFGLLGVIAREVATYLAEQRATRSLLETRDLRLYGERFAFVAHDIKNIAGQLRLLLSNADKHIADPAFQRDMLGTIDASVHKIGNLIRRLEVGEGDAPAAAGQDAPLLLARVRCAIASRAVASLMPRGRGVDGWRVAMAEADLDAVLTHLLDNAAAAVGSAGRVQVSVYDESSRMVVDIIDNGPGMTPEFMRDELFRPFSTRTVGGSGIGAYQARELLRRAGGDLLVLSRPGHGTIMRLLLPRPRPALMTDPNAAVAVSA